MAGAIIIPGRNGPIAIGSGSTLGPVAFDAKSTAVTTGNGVTSVNDNNLTVGSGSKRGLLAFLQWNTSAVPSGLSVTWNGAAMTSVASATDGVNMSAAIFGLAAPASGNNTLAASWTGSCQVYIAGAAYTGVNQTGGTTSFPHGTSNTGTATVSSVVVTSASTNMAAAVHAQVISVWGAISGTTIFSSTVLAQNAAANYDAGAATVTLTAAMSNGAFVAAGVDIQAG